MIRQLSGTTGTRILTTALGVATIVMATRSLGAHEYGNISLFLLSISLIQLTVGVVGGPALVYLAPRMPVAQLFTGSLLWSVVIHLATGVILTFAGVFTPLLRWHLLILSFLFYLNSFAYTTLLGKQKISHFNLIQITQALLLLCAFAVQLSLFPGRDLMVYIRSLYIAWGIACIYGWTILVKAMEPGTWHISAAQWLNMVRHGGFLQIANGLQLLNYRLSYFLIDLYLGRSLLGIYTAGVQLSEGLWIFGKSFAIVQYSSISNSQDRDFARELSIRLMKFIFVLTLLGLLILLILPPSFYAFLLGEGFGPVKTVILFMAAGILSLSVSQILSHYFSGTGQQKHNALGSGIGLAATLILGFALIPTLGLAGAGITASAAYTASTIYQMIVFVRVTNCTWRKLWFAAEDFREIAKLVRKLWHNQIRN